LHAELRRVLEVLDGAAAAAVVVRARGGPAAGAGTQHGEQRGTRPPPFPFGDGDPRPVARGGAVDERGAAIREPRNAGAARRDAGDLHYRLLTRCVGRAHGRASPAPPWTRASCTVTDQRPTPYEW